MTNEFWEFSLNVYAAPGVSGECLDLQDRLGADVNLLLFAAYAGSRGLILSAEDIDECSRVVQQWREQIIKPLRSIRQLTKTFLAERSPQIGQHIKDFCEGVKSVELESEKVQQELLFQWIEGKELKQPASGVELSIRNNVESMLHRTVPMGQSAESSRLISASVMWAKVVARKHRNQ